MPLTIKRRFSFGWIALLCLMVAFTSCHNGSQNGIIPTSEHLATAWAAEPVTPDGFPGQVRGVRSSSEGYMLTSPVMCVSLRQEVFWEIGDFWSEERHLPSIELELDGKLIDQFWREDTGPLVTQLGPNNEVLGTHGFQIVFCFYHNLEEGMHLLAIKIIKRSQEQAPILWRFKIQPG